MCHYRQCSSFTSYVSLFTIFVLACFRGNRAEVFWKTVDLRNVTNFKENHPDGVLLSKIEELQPAFLLKVTVSQVFP